MKKDKNHDDRIVLSEQIGEWDNKVTWWDKTMINE